MTPADTTETMHLLGGAQVVLCSTCHTGTRLYPGGEVVHNPGCVNEPKGPTTMSMTTTTTAAQPDVTPRPKANAAKTNGAAKKAPAARKAAASKATPAKAAAATKAAPAARHANCPLCGFKFKTPKAKCSDTNACAKRAAERKAAAKK